MDVLSLKKLLIAYDFSPCADRALTMGAGIAAKFGADVIVANVIDQRNIDAIEQAVNRAILARIRETPDDMVRDYKENRLQKLQAALKPFVKSGVRVKPKICVGQPVQEILCLAQEQAVDMIVMGARGHGRLARLLTGSKAESLFRISSIPILSVRREEDFYDRRPAITAVPKGSGLAGKFINGRIMTLKKFILSLMVAFVFGWFPGQPGTPLPAGADEQIVAGFLEKVSIGKDALLFKAKLDTGAKNSSMNADDIRTFKRNGVSYVSFAVTDTNGKTLHLERKAHRVAEVKMRDESLQARPVVRLPICLGSIRKEVEVNLVDRSFFNYQVLIGRSFLAGAVLVDAGAKYLHDPKTCRQGGAP